MDDHSREMAEINISGRVFVICQSRGVVDPQIIRQYREIFHQEMFDQLSDEFTPSEFNQLLDKTSAWLEAEIDQTNPQPTTADKPKEAPDSKVKTSKSDKQTYIPEAKSMAERLADQRQLIERLLARDCVDLMLITPDQVSKFKRRMIGVEPAQAEKDIVADLRNILHQQIRAFIRKHEGGPWGTVKLQNELRLDIAATKSLQSLVNLTRELISERDSWLQSNPSIADRLFGGRVKVK